MSLSTVKMSEIVKQQFFYKLKAYIDSLSSLIVIQIVAILFSLGGSNSYSSFSGIVHTEVKSYSADLVIIFTMIWAFTTAITVTTKAYRYQDFTFVTNRLTSSLSNILYLIAASLVGAITAMLSKYLLIIAGYFVTDGELYMLSHNIGDFFIGLIVSFLYILLIAAIGYLIGAFVQTNKLFTVIIPLLFIGFLYLDFSAQRKPIIEKIFQFYVEPSLMIFTLKVTVTAAIVFAASIPIFNRMEVRK